MNGWFQVVLDCYHHAHTKKSQLSTHKHTDISYCYTVQYFTDSNSRPPLDALVIKQVQGIVSAQLYYVQAVNNKLLVALKTIGDH